MDRNMDSDKISGCILGFILGDVLGNPFRFSRRRRFLGMVEPVVKKRGFSLGEPSPTLSRALGLTNKSRSASSVRELAALSSLLERDFPSIQTLAHEIAPYCSEEISFESAMDALFRRMWRCDASERASIVGAAVGARMGMAAMLAEPITAGNLGCIDVNVRKRIFELAREPYYEEA